MKQHLQILKKKLASKNWLLDLFPWYFFTMLLRKKNLQTSKTSRDFFPHVWHMLFAHFCRGRETIRLIALDADHILGLIWWIVVVKPPKGTHGVQVGPRDTNIYHLCMGYIYIYIMVIWIYIMVVNFPLTMTNKANTCIFVYQLGAGFLLQYHQDPSRRIKLSNRNTPQAMVSKMSDSSLGKLLSLTSKKLQKNTLPAMLLCQQFFCHCLELRFGTGRRTHLLLHTFQKTPRMNITSTSS